MRRLATAATIAATTLALVAPTSGATSITSDALSRSVLPETFNVASQDADAPPDPEVAQQGRGSGPDRSKQAREESSTTVVTTATTLPAAEPQAQVYPRPANGIYDIVGGGWGHRIGMSQYGAHGAGLAGLSYAQILAFYYPGTNLVTRPNGTIRIGITIDNDGVTRVAHRSGLRVSNSPGGTTYALPGDRTQWRVRATSSSASSCVLEGKRGSTWSGYWPSGMAHKCPVTFSSPSEHTVDLYLPSGTRRIYRGKLTATSHGSSRLATVNHIDTQLYLRSVVGAEMPSYFHAQGLRAQAVAARTYALRGVNGTSYYDTCDTTVCQAYPGRGVRQGDGSIYSYEYAPNTAAVDATLGKVLTFTFDDGVTRLATTMYAAASGGWTIAAGNGHDYLTSQPDPYDDTPLNPRHLWHAKLPVTSLEARYNIHRVERVQVLTRDGIGLWGGRILKARVEGYTSGGNYVYKDTTGLSLSLARPWPNYSTGLSTDYFTFGSTFPPEDPAPVRISGATRYGTAAEVSKAWSPGVSVVYVASGDTYPDALAAASRAGIYDAPVLLTKPNSLPTATRGALTRLNPGRLVVVGGRASVSEKVTRALAPYASSGRVDRVAGADRYGTAAALASYYPRGVDRVFLASGQQFPDALSAAARSGHEGMPLLLTRAGRLPAATITQLQRLDPGEIVVIGGTKVVSKAVARRAATYSTSGTYRRVAGANRYQTSAELAKLYPAPASPAIVASGELFPDAVVGAARASHSEVPLVLSRRDRIDPGTARALNQLEPSSMFVLGGTAVITRVNLGRLGEYLR